MYRSRSDPRDDIEIGLTATQIRDFSNPTLESGNRTDWGKIRHSLLKMFMVLEITYLSYKDP